jgi:alkanesulfonate monooxygenase SsuD/methylene tetrahydromethanopterin reductase-like flavin-dependent oxidoreductase (luciferase family)
VPAYAAFHRWLGRQKLLGPMWEAWAAGDRRGAAAAVPDEVVDALVLHGSPEQCVAQVRRYAEHGVDVPVLALLPTPELVTGGAAALAALIPRLGPGGVAGS